MLRFPSKTDVIEEQLIVSYIILNDINVSETQGKVHIISTDGTIAIIADIYIDHRNDIVLPSA